MVPKKGSGSEGSATFSGDFKDCVFIKRKKANYIGKITTTITKKTLKSRKLRETLIYDHLYLKMI